MAYFWSFFTEPTHRREMLRNGWRSVGKVFCLAIVLDLVYQVIVLRWFYPIETLLVAFLLAIVPYLLVRGPANRLAAEKRRKHESTGQRGFHREHGRAQR